MSKMMPMMRGMMMSGGEGMGMVPFAHVEGRIAFLKAELAITDAQLPQWNEFAEDPPRRRERHARDHVEDDAGGMPATAPARPDAMVQMMEARLDGMKAMGRM